LQVVAERGKTAGFEDIAKCGGTGSSFRIVGEVVKSPAKGQVRLFVCMLSCLFVCFCFFACLYDSRPPRRRCVQIEVRPWPSCVEELTTPAPSLLVDS